jgi:hypothetical protein
MLGAMCHDIQTDEKHSIVVSHSVTFYYFVLPLFREGFYSNGMDSVNHVDRTDAWVDI